MSFPYTFPIDLCERVFCFTVKCKGTVFRRFSDTREVTAKIIKMEMNEQ